MPTPRPSALSALLLGVAASIGATSISAAPDDQDQVDSSVAAVVDQAADAPSDSVDSTAADKPPHSTATSDVDEDEPLEEPCLLSPTLFHSLPDDHNLTLPAAVEADPMDLSSSGLSASSLSATSSTLAFPSPAPPPAAAGTDFCTSSPLRKRRRCGTADRDVKALLSTSSNQPLPSELSDNDDTDSALALHSRSVSRNSPQVLLSSSAPSSYASSKRRVYGPLPPLSFDVSKIPPYCPKRAVNNWLNKPTRHIDPPSAIGCLHPGAVFSGSQRSGANEYSVQVRLINVDLPRSHLSAFLDINGLTAVQPDITTYLEAEIIGPHHSFLTKRWEADESVDREHWRKFPEFRNEVGDLFKQDGYVYDSRTTDIVFMRWKELFLVPDHSQTSIDGASFSGFYYIACNVRSGAIVGYYYSANSEWFQRLDLDYEPAQGIPSFEFR